MKKPWSGRFKESTDTLMEQFSASISFDRRLYAYDIEGSIAHCQMLAKCKIISQAESKKIVGGLKRVLKEFESGKFQCDDRLEDIHMNIESRLTELVGAVGGKLHTARSRNDQVCLDIRLYLRDEVAEIVQGITLLAKTLLKLARKHTDTIIPGYTHMQQAQPILLAHHLLAHIEMLVRDRERMEDAWKRINIMPLGAAALSGTGFPIDRKYTAKLLNFPEVSHNSIDSVSDRDFAIEFCSASGILMMHLSRFCEEVVLWSSCEFDWLELSDAYTTGSSIMPQKKNPDAAELIRGKSGRVYGNLVSMLTLMKSLPLAYNKDLQEDKEPVFDTVDTVKVSLAVFEGMMKTAEFKKIPMDRVDISGFLTATDMADYLAAKGVPFRLAHEITGQTVAYCIASGKTLQDVTLKELKKISPRFNADVFDHITLESSVQKKDVYGGTAKKQVLAQIARLDKKLKTKSVISGKK
ncbi:MAG: argininosuccinate lyase [Nitrospinaceae bacterium]|jgi:argininosuccinate lyase|nr:argininosuccinate lyase [Nitrospinaceae bacterium]MDP6657336.1 argininosuccinate lyase [Nitrospinaceae bacterium]MDP6712776.1 argininosuccinate lyase [Nitrospinaceae bacterium]MDP7057242.1 argininosuccinate lyase [Nitrospinaceae bacterium]|tara:strand:+ start:135 stop:1535 length:1401 start_codon:yes stop_codon:yes gene_type:complete